MSVDILSMSTQYIYLLIGIVVGAVTAFTGMVLSDLAEEDEDL